MEERREERRRREEKEDERRRYLSWVWPSFLWVYSFWLLLLLLLLLLCSFHLLNHLHRNLLVSVKKKTNKREK